MVNVKYIKGIARIADGNALLCPYVSCIRGTNGTFDPHLSVGAGSKPALSRGRVLNPPLQALVMAFLNSHTSLFLKDT
jgi:hypothetical protein